MFQGFGFATRDAGLRQVLVSLRAIEERPDSCEVTLHGPVTPHNVGLALGSLLSTLAGGAGLAGGIGVGAAVGVAEAFRDSNAGVRLGRCVSRD